MKKATRTSGPRKKTIPPSRRAAPRLRDEFGITRRTLARLTGLSERSLAT